MDNNRFSHHSVNLDPEQLKKHIDKIKRKIARKSKKLEYSEQVAQIRKSILEDKQVVGSETPKKDLLPISKVGAFVCDQTNKCEKNLKSKYGENLTLSGNDESSERDFSLSKQKHRKALKGSGIIDNKSNEAIICKPSPDYHATPTVLHFCSPSFTSKSLRTPDENNNNKVQQHIVNERSKEAIKYHKDFTPVTKRVLCQTTQIVPKELFINSNKVSPSRSLRLFPKFPLDKFEMIPQDFVLPDEFNVLKLRLVRNSKTELKEIMKSPSWSERCSLEKNSKKRLVKNTEENSPQGGERDDYENESGFNDGLNYRPKKCKFEISKTPILKSPFFASGSMTSCLQGIVDSPILGLHLTTLCCQGTKSTVAIVCQAKLVTFWMESCPGSWKIWYEWDFKRVKPAKFYFLEKDDSIAVVIISLPKTGPLATVLVCTHDKLTKTFTVKFSTSNLWWRKCFHCMGCTHSNNQGFVLAGMTKTQTVVLVNSTLSKEMNNFNLKYLSPINEAIKSMVSLQKMTNAVLGLAERTYYIWDVETGCLLETCQVNMEIERGLWSSCEQGIIFAIVISKSITSFYHLIAISKGNVKKLRSYTREIGQHVCSHCTKSYFLTLENNFTVCIWNLCSGQLIVRLKSTSGMTVVHPLQISPTSDKHLLAIGFENGCTHIYQ